jgi:hypothetical protein
LKSHFDWVLYYGDVCPVSDIPEELNCDTLIIDQSVFHNQGFWMGDENPKPKFLFDGFLKSMLAKLCVTKGFLVTVHYYW